MTTETAAGWRSRIVGHGEAPPASLTSNPRNWRTHPRPQLEALAGVLSEVGWVQDVLVNRTTGHVVDGHARIQLALSRKELTVPVVYVELSPEEEAKVLATLDPIGAMAGADAEQLGRLLADVRTDDAALRSALRDLADANGLDYGGDAVPGGAGGDESQEPPEPEFDRADELREKWKTGRGQLWRMRGHRLYCGDATDATDVARALGEVAPTGLFTSPPYLDLRDFGGRAQEIAAGWYELMEAVVRAPLSNDAQVLVNLGVIYRKGACVRYWDRFIDRMAEASWPLLGWYVWDKLSGFPGEHHGRLAPAHEWVFHFARTPVTAEKWVPSSSAGDASPRTHRGRNGAMSAFTADGLPVQPFKVADSVIRSGPAQTAATVQAAHPAVYPTHLPAHAFRSWPGRTWFDPFCGSGTTIVAAEQCNAAGVGMELEPKYLAVTLERLSQMGLDPRLEAP